MWHWSLPYGLCSVSHTTHRWKPHYYCGTADYSRNVHYSVNGCTFNCLNGKTLPVPRSCCISRLSRIASASLKPIGYLLSTNKGRCLVLRYQVSPVWAAGPSKGTIFCPLEEATGYLNQDVSWLRPLGPKFYHKVLPLCQLRCVYNVTQKSETTCLSFFKSWVRVFHLRLDICGSSGQARGKLERVSPSLPTTWS